MRAFEYAAPETEAEALALLNERPDESAVLAGGTDTMNLLRRELLAPARVVDLKRVASLRGIQQTDDGVIIGALTTLDDLLSSPLAADYHALLHVVDATGALQIRSSGTLGGDLCHLPNCWYFRGGHGLLGIENGESLPAVGDNRYHAILGNQGPAKFVNASRFAPGLIAWGAKVRIAGPEPHAEQWLPLEYFYVSPRLAAQGNTILRPGQIVTHIRLPAAASLQSASYEVLQLEGLDWPLAAAAACLDVEGGTVRSARIVMGHVAPVPWVAREAAQTLVGRQVTAATAALAGEVAVAAATPLSQNEYKVQLARTAVKRAVLRAVGQLEGGL